MEPETSCITLERESTITIRGIEFIVTSHYDDKQESLKEKVARLLKNELCTLDKP